MKILVCRSSGYIAVDANDLPTTSNNEESLGHYLALEKEGYTPYLLSNTPSKTYRTLDFDNIEDIDHIFIDRLTYNFFGGKITPYFDQLLSLFADFTGDISVHYTDPDIGLGNMFSDVVKKGVETASSHDKIQRCAESINYDRCTVRSAYPVDVNHPIHDKFGAVTFIDSWRESIFNVKWPTPLFDYEHDQKVKSLQYIGSNKSSRHRVLKELGILTDNDRVKYYGKISSPWNKTSKSVNIAHRQEIYDKHVGSLVLGHRKQHDSGINHRFLLGLKYGSAMCIHGACDSAYKWTQGTDLDRLIYFNGSASFYDVLARLRDPETHAEIIEQLESVRVNISTMTAEQYKENMI